MLLLMFALCVALFVCDVECCCLLFDRMVDCLFALFVVVKVLLVYCLLVCLLFCWFDVLLLVYVVSVCALFGVRLCPCL